MRNTFGDSVNVHSHSSECCLLTELMLIGIETRLLEEQVLLRQLLTDIIPPLSSTRVRTNEFSLHCFGVYEICDLQSVSCCKGCPVANTQRPMSNRTLQRRPRTSSSDQSHS